MTESTSLDPVEFFRTHVAPRSRRRIDELRGQIKRCEAELADRLAAEATIEIMLEGDGGGIWYLNLREGDTEVSPAPAGPPLVRVVQTRQDWEALARAELASGGGDGGMPAGGDLTRSRVERLRGLRGTLEFRLAADDGERRTVVHFGDGTQTPPAPRCTLRLRADDARRLRNGEVAPQAAFLQGLVKLEGDLAFAMQVGAALFL